MIVECPTCGAPLQVADGEARTTCAYCGASGRFRAARARGQRADPAGFRRAVIVMSSGGTVLAAIFVFMGLAREPPASAPSTTAPIVEEPAVQLASEPRETPAPAPQADDEQDEASDAPAAHPPEVPAQEPPPPPRTVRQHPKAAPATQPAAPTGPIIEKGEAQKVLEPEILTCMKRERVHHLIVRVGQGYGVSDKGPLAPLTIVGDAHVDYAATSKLGQTPLGACITRAIAPVRTRAFKGNYMYFGLTNEAAPDPLAGADAHIDRDAALAALSALDDEARDCAKRFPDAAPEGKALHIRVQFRGLDGSPTRVEPYYIDPGPYLKCLEGVYRKARVPQFRKLDETVVHDLAP